MMPRSSCLPDALRADRRVRAYSSAAASGVPGACANGDDRPDRQRAQGGVAAGWRIGLRHCCLGGIWKFGDAANRRGGVAGIADAITIGVGLVGVSFQGAVVAAVEHGLVVGVVV